MTEQDRFEAYANTQGYSIEKDEQGLYLSVETFCHWGTWQAAIASREPLWLPIESAPKDAPFLVMGKDSDGKPCIIQASYFQGDIFPDHLGCMIDRSSAIKPKQWMPLPPPQKE